jgi:hypothetical protein
MPEAAGPFHNIKEKQVDLPCCGFSSCPAARSDSGATIST